MVDTCVWTLEVLILEGVLHTYQLMLSGQTACRLWWCHFGWIYYPSSSLKLNSCSGSKSWWEPLWFLGIHHTVQRHPWHHLLWSKFLLLIFANFWIQHFSKKLASEADLSRSPFLRRDSASSWDLETTQSYVHVSCFHETIGLLLYIRECCRIVDPVLPA